MRKDFSNNPLVRHAIEFSLLIIAYTDYLETIKKFAIARQLIRSGTAIGANVMEAQSAESKADFVHKLKLADKEAHETWYWLYLCEQSKDYNLDNTLMKKLDEIMKLLNAIILSSKAKKEQ